MSEDQVKVPLHSKSDPVLAALGALFFFSTPFWMLVEGKFEAALVIALLCWPLVWWMFGSQAAVMGLAAVITPTELSLVRRGATIWILKWIELEAVLMPNRISPLEELEFFVSGSAHPLRLRHVLSAVKRAEFKHLLIAHLPPGVAIEAEVRGFAPSRMRYLWIGLLAVGFGVAAIFASLSWISRPDTKLAQAAILVYFIGMVAIAVGLVQLVCFAAWRPGGVGSRRIKVAGSEDSLFVALKMHYAGLTLPEKQHFRYPEKLRSFNFPKQRAWTWVSVSLFALVLSGMTVAAHFEGGQGTSKAQGGAGILFVDGMVLFVIGALTIGSHVWAKQVERLWRHLDMELVMDDGRIFVNQKGRLVPARILKPPKFNFAMRHTSGLNSASMEIEADGQSFWIDPLSLRRYD